MATKSKTEEELWEALKGLDDDLLDPDLPETLVDEELKAIGFDPIALAKRGVEFVATVKEEGRLAWQTQARERRAALEARAQRASIAIPAEMDRATMLARMDELRTSSVGTAIRMAARKRKPEESTDEELRTLLAELEALRALEGDKPE